jgi:5-oxoprolinase (ATP-hydrolysing) subunit A
MERERASASEPRERSGAEGPRERAGRGAPGGEAPRMKIDINCDMGESFGSWTLGADAEVLPHITSANIACGAHAGDPSVMRRTVRMARAAAVRVGAHPGFADLQGFGRREMQVDPAELEDSLIAQIGALAAIAQAEGVPLQHVKAHGALYNMAVREQSLAEAIARAIAACGPSLVMFGLPNSALLAAGRAAGLRVAAEGFADRSYEEDGSLTPRGRPGAVIHDPEAVVLRAVRMIRDGIVLTAAGREIPLRVDTICVHGDTPGAPELTRRIHAALTDAGVTITPIGGWL